MFPDARHNAAFRPVTKGLNLLRRLQPIPRNGT
jgi:hypothetical protein